MDAESVIYTLIDRFSWRRNPYNHVAARRALDGLPSSTLLEMATRYLMQEASAQARRRTRSAERAAQREGDRALGILTPAQRRAKHRREEAEAQSRGFGSAFGMRMHDLTDEWKQELRVEWTAELLDSPFALPDGTRTTWGDATAKQHRDRVAMFESNALANVEGAVRHQRAVDALTESGAKSLRKMVNRPARKGKAS